MNDLPALAADFPLSTQRLNRITVASAPAELERHLQAWEQLFEQAVEPNIFYSPWALLSALHHLGGSRAVRVLLFFRDDERTQLDGILPLFGRQYGKLLANLHSYRHRYCFSAEPLLRRGCEQEVAQGFVTWLRQFRCPLLNLQELDAEGAWFRALQPALRQGGLQVHQSAPQQRALLRIDEGLQAFEQHLPPKRHKEYRRRRSRLAELGDLQVEVLQPGARDLRSWLDDFIALELKGWKGREGTALGNRPECRRFFEDFARSAHARGALVMLRMSLDGKPLSMICDFLAPPGRFAFKTAYDEDFARFAPGTLLEYESARMFFQDPRKATWLDSCASPDNEYLNWLYPARRTLVNLRIGAPGPAALALSLTVSLKRLRQLRRGGGKGSWKFRLKRVWAVIA